MYSYHDRLKAVELYIEYGKRAAATVLALGYPSTKQLKRWYQIFKHSGCLPKQFGRRSRYSPQQRLKAVEHYTRTGQSVTFTVRTLGYPSKPELRRWVKESANSLECTLVKTSTPSIASLVEKKVAVVELCSRQTSAEQVSQVFGVSRQTLYKWRNQLLDADKETPMKRRRNQDNYPDRDELQAEIKALEKRVHELQLEHDILIKAGELIKKENGVNPQTLSNREKTQLVDALNDTYQLAELLVSINLPRSSYYYHRKALKRPDKYAEARQEIALIFESNYRCYGYRRIDRCLRRAGTPLSEKVVRRLMSEEGLIAGSMQRRRFKTYRGELSPAPENIISRDFESAKPNQKWLTDLTEFSIPPGKVYLSPMIDCFDGLVVSWTISPWPNANLVNTMLDKAIQTLTPGETPTVHTDRGCHYRWPGWIERIDTANLIRSMSRKGCTPDNAACEAFFGRLKTEFFYPRQWAGVSTESFIAELDAYIRWYNEVRIKISLGGKSPIEYRYELGIAA